MRKFIVFVAACFLMCGLFLSVQTASAATAWVQGDKVNALSIRLSSPDLYSFGIYDFKIGEATATHHLDLLTGVETFQPFLIYQETNDSWWATELSIENEKIGTPMELLSEQFGFYVYKKTDPTNYLYDYTFTGGGNTWTLEWTGLNVSILATDVKPVPIPTAILFLGSGLVGLVGFRRKTNR